MQKTVFVLGLAAIGAAVLLFRYDYDDSMATRIDRITGVREVFCEHEWQTTKQCWSRPPIGAITQPSGGLAETAKPEIPLLDEMKRVTNYEQKICKELAKRKSEGRLHPPEDKSVEPWKRWWGDVPESCAHLMPSANP